MRQFLFGLLCAALVWWGYSAFSAADAGASSSPPTDPKQSQVLEIMRNSADAAAPAANPAPGEKPAEQKPVEAAAQVPGDLPALLASVRAGEAGALSQAWQVIAGEAGRRLQGRAAVLEALAANPIDDAAKALRVLGNGNSFLHSAEGRVVAQRAMEMAAAQPPEPSARLLTQLLEKCMRGDIARTDQAARAFVDAASKELRRHVDRSLCDPSDLSRARSYTVRQGDSLAAIASRFRKEGLLVEAMTLGALNRIHNPKTLRAGQKIKVPLDPVKTVVEKRSFLMAVYVGDVILRLYWVGHGADDKTPVAIFKVTEVLANPQWDAPDGNQYPPGHPKNILGKWFVRLTHDYHHGFGIHGTTQPETIGTMASMGCIRMLDPDIEEFAGLVPRGSLVDIRESK